MKRPHSIIFFEVKDVLIAYRRLLFVRRAPDRLHACTDQLPVAPARFAKMEVERGHRWNDVCQA